MARMRRGVQNFLANYVVAQAVETLLTCGPQNFVRSGGSRVMSHNMVTWMSEALLREEAP
jgi:hypothetical protein